MTGYAAQEPYLFISWHVRAGFGADTVEFDGVDRFRLRGEKAEEVYAIFDPARSKGSSGERLRADETADSR